MDVNGITITIFKDRYSFLKLFVWKRSTPYSARSYSYSVHKAIELAFQEYNKSFRPFIEEVQANAEMMVDFLVPRTEEAIRERISQAASIKDI
jgi:hypothetical protein